MKETHKIGDKHVEWLEAQNCSARVRVVTNMVLENIVKDSRLQSPELFIAL
ncbi:hypothetical protein [Thalassotalea eurytherma]|uniref:hypothetical protein n=1 Tax=Thalassotalea eurytherma TaxID=1144278 RepID=UPI0024E183CD|nr:hypothetical protein [Thalassotalea eurytherma]